MSVELAEVDAGSSIFECGQLYVGLSRVTSLDGLFLTSFDVNSIQVNKKVCDYYNAINEYKKTHPDQLSSSSSSLTSSSLMQQEQELGPPPSPLPDQSASDDSENDVALDVPVAIPVNEYSLAIDSLPVANAVSVSNNFGRFAYVDRVIIANSTI
jgi:hypothetical protein